MYVIIKLLNYVGVYTKYYVAYYVAMYVAQKFFIKLNFIVL